MLLCGLYRLYKPTAVKTIYALYRKYYTHDPPPEIYRRRRLSYYCWLSYITCVADVHVYFDSCFMSTASVEMISVNRLRSRGI